MAESHVLSGLIASEPNCRDRSRPCRKRCGQGWSPSIIWTPLFASSIPTGPRRDQTGTTAPTLGIPRRGHAACADGAQEVGRAAAGSEITLHVATGRGLRRRKQGLPTCARKTRWGMSEKSQKEGTCADDPRNRACRALGDRALGFRQRLVVIIARDHLIDFSNEDMRSNVVLRRYRFSSRCQRTR